MPCGDDKSKPGYGTCDGSTGVVEEEEDERSGWVGFQGGSALGSVAAPRTAATKKWQICRPPKKKRNGIKKQKKHIIDINNNDMVHQ